MTIKTSNGDKIIDPITTEPSKPYLAQKLSNGTDYYPVEIRTSEDGLLVKGNNVEYVVKEDYPTLQLLHDPSPLSQVKIYDQNNVLKATYDNPTTDTIIKVYAGGKIEWIHDPSWYWIYRIVGGEFWDNVYVDGGANRSNCFSNVPSDAEGAAKLTINFFTSSHHDTILDFSNYSGSQTTGWIQSSYCYPYV